MSKKKKTSAKQTKPNLQKPSAKAAKEAAAPKQSAAETSLELDVPSKSVEAQQGSTKVKKPEQGASKPSKPEPTKAKVEPGAKPEPTSSKAEQSSPKQSAAKTAQSQPKPPGKEAGQQAVDVRKKEETKPSPKGQKGGKGGKKKDKAPRQSVDTPSPNAEPAVPEVEPNVPVSPAEPVAEESSPSEAKRKVAKTLIDEETDFTPGRQGSEGDSMSASQPTTVAPVSPPADAASPSDGPRKIAKTILEVNIGGLKEAAAKATGVENKAQTPPPEERNVAKTLMEASTEGLRDAVEASSRAIEDEIAAAIRESDAGTEGLRDTLEASSRAVEDEIAAAIRESEAEAAPKAEPQSTTPAQSGPAADAAKPIEPTAAEQMVAAAAKNPEVKPADRKIAKTMLDFRADELFELANSDIDTLVEEVEPESPPTPAPQSASAAPAPPAIQSRKVAKTMLEVDVPDMNALVEAAQAAALEPVAQAEPEPVVQESVEPAVEEPAVQKQPPSYDEVSMEDLNEFAQALREDKPMSARAERLRKTMLGIRKHGLASSASMPGVGTTGETNHPDIAAQDAPVRVSRSLHPLDNFSFDNLCPADEETQNQSVGDAQIDAQDNAQSESLDAPSEVPESSIKWRSAGDQVFSERTDTGTVEMQQDPHEGSPDGEFKGTSTVWPHDEEQKEQQQQLQEEVKAGTVKPERFVPKTMLDMDFLKESLSASVIRAEEKMAESIALKAQEPQKQTLTSDDYKIASPNCPFVWSSDGVSKDRVRYCTQCSSQVYDFAGFDMAEAQSLIFKRENRDGATLYKREDGKFLTNDCPIALKKKKDTAMLVGGGVLALVLLVIMVVISFMTPQPPAPAPTVEAGTERPAPSTGSRPSSGSPSSTGSKTTTQATGTTTEADADGTFHYKRGKPATQAPAVAQPVVVPQTDTTTVPGTTSGYDEGGQFWQYTDKGNQ